MASNEPDLPDSMSSFIEIPTERERSESASNKRKQSFDDRAASGNVANTSDEESSSDVSSSDGHTPGDGTVNQQVQRDLPKNPSPPVGVLDEALPTDEARPSADPRIAKQQARLDALRKQVSDLTAEIDGTKALLRNPDANATVARHIRLLHEYNEIRDVGLGLMGMVAERRAVRVALVMAEYGIGDGD